MPERLRDDVDGLLALCTRAADWFASTGRDIPAAVIEKDFWVTEVLRSCAKPWEFDKPDRKSVDVRVRAVFKGGTSLSKAFGIIDRFSEDADLYLCFHETGSAANIVDVGSGRADSLLKAFATAVSADTGLDRSPVGNPRTGTKRTFNLDYPRAADAPTAVGLTTGVQLELVRMGAPNPSAPHELRSMLSEWVVATNSLTVADWEELSGFTMDVLDPTRTLVDKMCLLNDAAVAVAADPSWIAKVPVRHYYDVYRLLSNPAVLTTLRSQDGLVVRYAAEAEADGVVIRRVTQPRPTGGFAASNAFAADYLSLLDDEWVRTMDRLAYNGFPPLSDVAAVVEAVADLL